MKVLHGAHLGLGLFLVSSAAPLGAQVAEVAKLLASDAAMDDRFGHAVSIFGDRALVGAPFDDDLADYCGSAYVFERNAAGTWSQVAKLLASDGAAGDVFGWQVSIFADRALIGAYGDDDLGSASGSAYVFERTAAGAWTEVAKLRASDGKANDRFAFSVSLSGHRALVGAYTDKDLGINSGSAYVFERNAGGTWTEVAKLLASDGDAYEYFGVAVSISRDRALVGAYLDDDLGYASGSAYMFERGSGGVWTEVTKILASDGDSDDRFGTSVSISGDRALVGSYADSDLGVDSGSAYVFERNAAGAWTQAAKLLASDGAAGAVFGDTVSISGDRALVGAWADDDLGSFSGSAYLFERDAGGTWTQVGKLLASDGGAGDRFGGSVSIHGDRALVGASEDDDQGVGSGSAYVFEGSAGAAPLPSSEVARLGSPPNPDALLPGLTGGPVLGSTWEPMIEHASFLTGAALDFLCITVNPVNLHLPPLGTLLCDPALAVAIETAAVGATFAILFPSDGVFAGASLYAQGASVDASGAILLTNALDIAIGAF